MDRMNRFLLNIVWSSLSYSVSFLQRRRPTEIVTMADVPIILKQLEASISTLEILAKSASSRKKDTILILIDSLHTVCDTMCELKLMVTEIELVMASYDLSEETSGNGYRSFVSIADKAANTAYNVVNRVTSPASNREVEELVQLLKSLVLCFTFLLRMERMSSEGSLYPKPGIDFHEMMELAGKVHQTPFYSTFIAFQFGDSMRRVLTGISLFMASYSEIYYGASWLRIVERFIIYLIDPVRRGLRHTTLIHHAGVDFIKAFWSYSECPVVMIPMRVMNGISVSRAVEFSDDCVQLGRVTITPSYNSQPLVHGRLISKHPRKHMLTGEAVKEASPQLLIHVHGGGFISQSARTQEIFLRKWAHALDVPIFSIDYATAPEHPYPRAVQQVFFSYCVALAHADMLGSTAETIVMVGDSAGANLILGVVQECLKLGVRVPDGLALAYVPVLVSFVPSPARLLGVLDPLLPFGIMMRCAKAYVEGKTEDKPPLSTCTCSRCKNISQVTFLDNPHLSFNSESFLLDVPVDPNISPYQASDDVLKRLPPIALCSAQFDPCLDDTVMFARRLRRLGVPISLDIAPDLPHGFFNFCGMDQNAGKATMMFCQRISQLLNKTELTPLDRPVTYI